MSKSRVPADHEIRILLTIKNGKVTERQLLDNEIISTLDGFISALKLVGFRPDDSATPKE